MRKFLKSNKRSKAVSGLIALILTLSIVLSTFSGLFASAGNAEVWNGTTASEFASGTGAAGDPYIIENGSQLRYLVGLGAAETAGKFYKLANDIYLNDVSVANWHTQSGLNEWPMVNVDEANAFRGTFYGDGHIVYGIYTEEVTAYNVPDVRDLSVAAGLFPVIAGGASIDAVGVEKAYVKITNACTEANANKSGLAGAIVGAYMGNSAAAPISVTRCYAADTVKLIAGAAGFIGGNPTTSGTGVSITNCYNLLSAEVHTAQDSNARSGFIAYYGGGAVISGCFGIGNIAGTLATKGAVDNYVTSWNSGAGSSVSPDAIYGGDAAETAMPDLDWEGVYMTTSTSPILRVFYRPTTGGEGGDSAAEIWDGSISTSLSGSGTAGDPYLIKNGSDLAYALKTGTTAGVYYALANDIYLNDTAQVNWATGEGYADYTPNYWFGQYDANGTTYAVDGANGLVFKGNLNGNGFTVYGLCYKPGDHNSAAGLIPVANGSTVTNLRVKDSFVSAGRWGAVVVGYGTGVTVSNVVIDHSVTVHGYNAGAAYVTEDIYNVENKWPFLKYGQFESNGTGGIIGYANGSFTASNIACYANIVGSGFEYTVANPVLDGGTALVVNSGHVGGIIGTAWNTTLNVSDSISFYTPFDGGNGTGVTTFADVYTTSATISDKYTGVTQVMEANIMGAGAKNVLTGLNFETVWATTDTYPTLQIFNFMDPDEYWSGAEVEPTAGTGVPTDPIIISTPEELAYIVKNGMGGKHYKLANDIYLNDITKINWETGEAKTGYTPNSWYTKASAAASDGTFDGDGHKVYGLYSVTPGDFAWEQTGAGLFPHVARGEKTVADCKTLNITKLGVDYAYVQHPNAASAFVGQNRGIVNIDQSYVGANVTLKAHMAGAFIGLTDAIFTISNCYNLGTTVGTNSGLLGDNYGGQIENSGSLCSITNCYNATGAIRTKGATNGTEENCYGTAASAGSTTVLTPEQMQGLDAVTTGAMAGIGPYFQGTTTFPILTAFAPVKPAPETGTWDGSTKTAPSEGIGTEANPYIIYNAAELAYVVSSGASATAGKFYKLANDIFINEIDKINWETGVPADGYTANTWIASGGFAGTLDGDGHVVKGLYYKNTEKKEAQNSGMGLFSHVTGNATIKNLGVDYAYVENKHAAAAFVGNNTGSVTKLSISYSYVGENVTISGYTSAAFVGVSDKAFALDHVYNLGTLMDNVHDWTYEGQTNPRNGIVGLYGDIWGAGQTGSSVKNAYNATGPISDRGIKPNVVGTVFCTSDTDTAGAVILDAADMQGLDVFNNEKPMQQLNYDKTWEATNGYPILDIFAETTGNDGDEVEAPSDTDDKGIWTGMVLDTFSDNTSTGTEDDPIIITSPGELALAIKIGGEGKYYKLANDIYLNDITANATWHTKDTNNAWFNTSVPVFNGHIDGAGHMVYGIWYPADTTGAVGLVPKMQDGSVKNLGVRFSYIRSTQNLGAGAIIGYAAGVITVEKCFADETVSVASTTAGGIVGLAQQNNANSEKGLVMRNCYTKAKMLNTSSTKSNGLVGDPWITAYEIYDSYSYGSKPYNVGNNGGKSTMYWYHTTKLDEETNQWVTDVSEPKEGKVAADYFKNIYTSHGAASEDMIWTNIGADAMMGLEAAEKMPGLDFENTWLAVENGTPILKIFASSTFTGENVDLSADAETFDEGKGTKTEPYLIKTAAQLRYLVQSETTAGKYYALANDIYVNDTSNANWMTTAEPWYNNINSAGFQGTLDGQGHYIYGIYANQAPAKLENLAEGTDYIPQGTGLFSRASTSAEIRNVHIRKSYISGYGSTGAFVGEITGSNDRNLTIVGCSVDESVTVAGFTVGGFVGAGNQRTVDISYSYSTPELVFTGVGTRCNALVGDTWGGLGNNLAQIYSAGYPNMRGNVKTTDAVYSDVAGNGAKVVATTDMIGNKAKTAMPMLDWEQIFVVVNGDTPHIKVVPYGMSALGVDEGVKGRVWSGKMATQYAGGTGTEEDPYIIETPEQFVYMLNDNNTLGKFYSVTADLKLNDTSKSGWEETARNWIGNSKYFRGTLLGNGHVVTGLYYNTTDSQNAGLIPQLGHSSVIKQFGVEKSTIINERETSEHCYAGAMVGFLENYDGYMGNQADYENKKIPEFHECFIGKDVSVIGESVGGFIGGGAAPVSFYNCFVSCSLDGTYRNGAFYGDIWEGTNEEKCYFENCYAATANRDTFGMGPNSGQNAMAVNCYVDGTEKNGAVALNLFFMQGDRAVTNMPELDYDKIWKIVTGGTPVLRCFPNCEQYSNKREPQKVRIEFVTGDGSFCEPIEGYPLTTEIDLNKLPVSELYGYKFEGWYFYDTLDYKFNLKVFPNYNIHIYAKFEMDGHENGFEGKMYDDYDVIGGAYYHKPGIEGYNPKYINGGLRSMGADCDSEYGDPMFFLNYTYPLEVGNTYDVNFWVTTNNPDSKAQIQFVQGNYPDANDEMVGYNVGVEIENLTPAEWTQYRVRITANAPYLFVRAVGEGQLFFDDFQIVNLHTEGKLGNLIGYVPTDVIPEPEEDEEWEDEEWEDEEWYEDEEWEDEEWDEEEEEEVEEEEEEEEEESEEEESEEEESEEEESEEEEEPVSENRILGLAPITFFIIVGVAGGVLLLAAAAVTVIIILKKRNK